MNMLIALDNLTWRITANLGGNDELRYLFFFSGIPVGLVPHCYWTVIIEIRNIARINTCFINRNDIEKYQTKSFK